MPKKKISSDESDSEKENQNFLETNKKISNVPVKRQLKVYSKRDILYSKQYKENDVGFQEKSEEFEEINPYVIESIDLKVTSSSSNTDSDYCVEKKKNTTNRKSRLSDKRVIIVKSSEESSCDDLNSDIQHKQRVTLPRKANKRSNYNEYSKLNNKDKKQKMTAPRKAKYTYNYDELSSDESSFDDSKSDTEVIKAKYTYNYDELSSDESSFDDSESDAEVIKKFKNGIKKAGRIRITSEDVLNHFNNSTFIEFCDLIYLDKNRWEKLIALRPFENSKELSKKLLKEYMSSFIAQVYDMLEFKEILKNLLKQCESLTEENKVLTKKMTNYANNHDEENEFKLKPQPDILNKKLQLKDYQIVGMNWLIHMNKQGLNCILADEMGLGKTCQTISFMAYLYKKHQAKLYLVVVPSSTVENWSRELKNWFPQLRFEIYRGSPEERSELRKTIRDKIKKNKINLILSSYTLIEKQEKDRHFFHSLRFDICIYDEAHILRNMKTKRYHNLIKIQSKRKLLLTGTPIQNNLIEICSLLYFVMPHAFKNDQKMINKTFQLSNFKILLDVENDFNYNNKVEKARKILEPFILRRLKSDVLKEIPDKIYHTIKCEMEPRQRDFYIEIKNEFKNLNSKTLWLQYLTKFKKISNHPLLLRNIYDDVKIKKLAELYMKIGDEQTVYEYVVEDMKIMDDFELHNMCTLYPSMKDYELDLNNELYNSSKINEMLRLLKQFKENGDRVLIFGPWVIMLNIIAEVLKRHNHKFLQLNGRVQVEKRQSLIDEFNEHENILAFLITTKAGGVGINLTGANKVIIFDADNNPQNDKQAEDRSHRVGQNRIVDVYKLVTKDTFEEQVHLYGFNKLKLDMDVCKNILNPSSS